MPHAARDPRQDRGASGRRVRRLCERRCRWKGRRSSSVAPVAIEGRPLAAGETPPPRRIKFVSPGYFEAMGTRIIAGRDMTWSDIEAGGRVAVISEDFARELATEPADALGKRIRHARRQRRMARGDRRGAERPRGRAVRGSAEHRVLARAHGEHVRQRRRSERRTVAFVIRSDRAGTASLINEIRQAVWSVNGDVPIALERTMQDLYAGSLARTSFTLVMLAIAGCDGARARRHRDLRRHRVRRVAADAGDRDSDGARRRAPRGSSDVPAARARAQRRGRRDRPRGGACADAARCRRCCSASSRRIP